MINRTLAAALAALSLAVTPAALQAQDKPDAKPAAAPAPAPDYKPNSATKPFTGTFGTPPMRSYAPVPELVLKHAKVLHSSYRLVVNGSFLTFIFCWSPFP